MTRFEVLSFLESLDNASAEDIAAHFSMPRSYVYSRLTVLNRQGLITKRKGEDGVLRFGLTSWGREKLEWIEEREEDGEENEVKTNTGGETKMGRKRILDGDYVCPDCETEYQLEDVVEGTSDSLCPDCDVELEAIEDELDDEDEPEVRKRGR